tara:strand:+ start:12435 stop:13757 length:1323 start_codon:yes stop_codon:yes gene_type:complete
MKKYESFLKSINIDIEYVNSFQDISDIRVFLDKKKSISSINIYDPEDNWLEKRILKACSKNNIKLNIIENQLFITKKFELDSFFRADKKKFFQTSFYKSQRQKFNILMEEGKPEGGKWTYDDMNREKYPKDKTPPNINYVKANEDYESAKCYIEKNFNNNPGKLNKDKIYPYDFLTADSWFETFLTERYDEFGPYEDAVVKEKSVLNHSVLSPIINSGLLDPKLIMKKSVKFYNEKGIRLNSCEGFIRQIIGWREFIRGVYIAKGSEERTKNFWGFKRKIPKSFYKGTTGIEPVDDTINKINNSAYANHIERLMIIGNFMLLCEFDPDDVYKWFMELFIDSYDWVMVPNVYGMSQFADGGLMSTKPYISGSSYVLKMSNYKKGEWCPIWDSLFWNFINNQRDFFITNPRMRMLVSTYDKMNPEKKEIITITSNNFLKSIS